VLVAVIIIVLLVQFGAFMPNVVPDFGFQSAIEKQNIWNWVGGAVFLVIAFIAFYLISKRSKD
jgi:amino acid transporter